MAKESTKAQIEQDALDLAFLIYDIFIEEDTKTETGDPEEVAK